MTINQSKHSEKIYSGDKNQAESQTDIHKFDRREYSFVNGIKDDKNYLIIVKKGVLDELAEDATQDADSAKRVDSQETGLGYWTDEQGNLRFPGDGLNDMGSLGDARRDYIDGWKKV